jgi:hypothetical protein
MVHVRSRVKGLPAGGPYGPLTLRCGRVAGGAPPQGGRFLPSPHSMAHQEQTSAATPSAHTPGPWSVERKGIETFISDKDGWRVAEIVHELTFVPDNEQEQADAHLIAAAPEMLGLLREMADCWSRNVTCNFTPGCRFAAKVLELYRIAKHCEDHSEECCCRTELGRECCRAKTHTHPPEGNNNSTTSNNL